MKIAITGANGFVGSNLIKHFIAKGHQVTALVRQGSSLSLLPEGTQILALDYNDPEAITHALKRIDVLVHNAGKTKALNHAEMLKANLGTTDILVRTINQLTNPLHLIYISSQAASRPSRNNRPINEEEPSAPVTSYGKSKLAAEKCVRNVCLQPWTVIRPCSIYGCGDKDFLTLFKLAKRGFSFRIGHQDRLLNMIHVSELAAFIALCLNNPRAYNQVFFATDGCVYRQSQVTEAIAASLGRAPRTITIPESLTKLVFRTGDLYGRLLKKETIINKEKLHEILADSWLADTSKAQRLLGWNPTADLKQHILDTKTCYEELGWL